jgi:hypothetical protein
MTRNPIPMAATRRLLCVGVRRQGRWRIRTSLWRWLALVGLDGGSWRR